MKINWAGIVFIALIIILWQLIAYASIFNETLFPPPLAVLAAGIELANSGQLGLEITASILRLLAGLAFGAALAIAAGLLMGRILLFEETVAPLLHMLRAFPPVALIPLIIVWFGIGDTAKIIAIAFAVFFPVWISVLVGAKSLPRDYIRIAKIFSKSPIETYSKIVIPATIPFIVGGVRIGIAVAFIMVFVSELAGASSGLGYLIAYAQITYRTDIMLVGLVVLGLLAAATDWLFVSATRKIFPWVSA